MKYQTLSATVLAAWLLVTGSAYAQERPDLTAVPNQTPFNFPSGTPISLEEAQALIQAGVAEAKKRAGRRNSQSLTGIGQLVAFARMDGAQLGSIGHFSSIKRARRPNNFAGRRTHSKPACRSLASDLPAVVDDIIAVAGGIPLVENGKLVGAIGCSGGTTSQDEVLCEAVLGPPYMKNFSTLGN